MKRRTFFKILAAGMIAPFVPMPKPKRMIGIKEFIRDTCRRFPYNRSPLVDTECDIYSDPYYQGVRLQSFNSFMNDAKKQTYHISKFMDT